MNKNTKIDKYLIIGFSVFAFICIVRMITVKNEKTANTVSSLAESSYKNNSSLKIKIYNDVPKLLVSLSENGIGNLRTWRKDEQGWISSTDYYSFGNPKNYGGLENNLAYYVESENENYAKTVKIMLNINNNSESKIAKKTFIKTIRQTFKTINQPYIEKITLAVNANKDFYKDTNDYNLKLEYHKDGIDWWKITIESK